ncbi:MAG: hypothetical protein LQ345_002850 [Seirophora villosa]|nr:MAG: hypothetical protein LQ345_002850 [Seirophora villosa]
MNAAYICLRCRQKSIWPSHCQRSIRFISLKNRTSDTSSPQYRSPSPNHRPNGRRKDDSVEKNPLQVERPISKIGRSISKSDSALESLFSSHVEKQRAPIPTGRSRAQPSHGDDLANGNDHHPSRKTSAETSSNPPDTADRAGRVIAGLRVREEQIAEIEESLVRGLNGGDDNEPSLRGRKHQVKHLGIDGKRVTKMVMSIERARQRYDVAEVGVQWQKYQQTLTHAKLSRQSQEVIYTVFLTAYSALSRHDQVVEVWNHMVDTNIMPNARHWNAILKSCFKARDVTSLQEVWSNMITSGMKPDTVLWTTYIHGLIMCGKWQRGLQLLDQLGAKWTAARGRQSEPKDIVTEYEPSKPSLAPVQAALSGLTAIGRHELCPAILDWAKSHSLPLTTEIFNILLRPAVRSRDPQKVARIFSLMEANQCAADETTDQILLSDHMSNTESRFADLSPHEQQDSIFRILDDMTAKGTTIDRRIYSTILQGLLRSPAQKNTKNDQTSRNKDDNSNDNAAQAVLQYMDRNNVTPDSYMYHILVTHYFSLDPPDLAAVERVWARVQAERPGLQSIFYEKMVEGYAKVGAWEKMLFFLRKFPAESKSPRWRCLVGVLDTLIAAGEWGPARELVEDVQRGRKAGGLMRYAAEDVPGEAKQEFWDMVRSVSGKIYKQSEV